MGVFGVWSILAGVTERIHFGTLVERLSKIKVDGTTVTVLVDGYCVLYEVLAEFAEPVFNNDLSGYAIFPSVLLSFIYCILRKIFSLLRLCLWFVDLWKRRSCASNGSRSLG